MIFNKGQAPSSINNGGSVDNTSHYSAPKLIREQEEGDYFGEISLMTHLKRTATVKAKDFTTLGYIIARNF